MRWLGSVCAFVALWATACMAAGEIGDDKESTGVARPGIYIPIRADSSVHKTAFAPGGEPLPIYLHRHGGSYTGGDDDSALNRSSVVASTGYGAAEIPAFAGGDAAWTEIVSCVRGQFAPWNVRVTDVEPDAGAYIEVALGGDGAALGMAQYGGVAPIDTSACRLLSRAVVYVFTENLGNHPRIVCEVAAQEIGHAMSLDHVLLCEDPMTYLSGCGDKTFQDADAACGEYEARDCICGRAAQNSADVLSAQLGPASGENPEDPPTPGACGAIDWFGECDAAGRLTWCASGTLQTADCAGAGMTCGWQDDATGWNCLPPDPCGGVDYYGECTADGVLNWCQDGVLQTIDCAAAGNVCGWQDDSIGHNCLPPAACMGIDYYGQCSADGVLSWCQDGALQSIDCAAQGKTCGWQDESVGYNCL